MAGRVARELVPLQASAAPVFCDGLVEIGADELGSIQQPIRAFPANDDTLHRAVVKKAGCSKTGPSCGRRRRIPETSPAELHTPASDGPLIDVS